MVWYIRVRGCNDQYRRMWYGIYVLGGVMTNIGVCGMVYKASVNAYFSDKCIKFGLKTAHTNGSITVRHPNRCWLLFLLPPT